MSLNILSFLLFYFLIISSTIGYGYLMVQITGINKICFNHSYLGIIGIFSLIFLSYISHYIFAHSYYFNSIVLLIGLTSFLYFFSKDKNKTDLLKLNFLFLLLFISFIIYKSHDDFSYYHFQYIYYLTQNNLTIGIGNFNHGFRTPSSIFYLNSLFYLPILKYFFFNMGAILIMGFVCFNFFDLIQKRIKNKNFDVTYFFSLISFLFIIIFFYRIAEHGTDRSAQILIFLLIIELIVILNFNQNIKENVVKILVILILIISLKAFYILYLSFLIPVVFYFFKEKKKNYLLAIYKNYYFYFFIIVLLNILFVNFLNSGCFVYPVSFTCVPDLSWSIPLSEVSLMNDWYEQWAKAGANPNFRVDNPEQYIQNLNWISNWFSEYFFTKVSDFILGISLLSLVLFFLFKSEKNKFSKKLKGINFLYVVIFCLFVEWFYNHPSLRYGGYALICLFLFLPISIYFSSRAHDRKIIFKTYAIMIIALIIFFGRNVDRIMDENKKYGFNVSKGINYFIDDSYFLIQTKMEKIINNQSKCINKKKDCLEDFEIDVKNKHGFNIFYKK